MKPLEKDLYILIKELFYKRKHKELIKYAEQYLARFSKDNEYTQKVRYMKAKSLRFVGKFEQSEQELEEILKESYDSGVALMLFYLYLYTLKYEKALILLEHLYKDKNLEIPKDTLNVAEIFMNKYLGREFEIKGDYNNYTKHQIIDYKEDLLMDRINERFSRYNKEGIENPSYFNEKINKEYLVQLVRENIKTCQKANVLDLLDVYYFCLHNIGVEANNVCDFIKVIVIPNTTNILAIQPKTKAEENQYNFLNGDLGKLFNRDSNVMYKSDIHERYNK